MSLGEGSGSSIGVETMRGRDYPAIRQFTVFVENRVGMLTSLMRRFVGSEVRLLSMNIIDSTECSLIRMVFSHPEAGREILERAGLAMVESDLLAVELKAGEQPLLEVSTALLQAEVNLIQTCALMVPNYHTNVLGILVDNFDLACDVLASRKFRLLTENDLQDLSQ